METNYKDMPFLAETSFLNADLIIRSKQDLLGFARELEQRGLMTLHVDQMEDCLWQATFELEYESGNDRFDAILSGILDCIEALPAALQEQWRALESRTLDLGFEAGTETRHYTRYIRPDLLNRMINTGLVLAITIYSPVNG
ncbi:hypothetical protein ACUHMQ_07205 [Chitinimonas sp. PSY-7]|uniref:hypothetical protein n=1 Tax=Chitinimonas sp. PSY-7 TaxID=3459088 RepID=UPI0040403D54